MQQELAGLEQRAVASEAAAEASSSDLATMQSRAGELEERLREMEISHADEQRVSKQVRGRTFGQCMSAAALAEVQGRNC